MKVGDLVRNLNSESRMTGVIVGWSDNQEDLFPGAGSPSPIVLWADGRCNWIVRRRVEVVDESR